MDNKKRLRNRSVSERFHAKYEVKNSGCWEWTESFDGNGRGGMTIEGTRKLAHILSYSLHKGEVPKGLCVCHKCDNPLCVNPNHLFLGTQIDNLKDMREKGRHVFGTRNGTSKLNDLSVIIAREARLKGYYISNIARYFKVNESVMSKAIRGITWGHV